jgi:hypothetical protein
MENEYQHAWALGGWAKVGVLQLATRCIVEGNRREIIFQS